MASRPRDSELRVAVALADRWEGTLLCAELRERGCNPRCVEVLALPLLATDAPVDVILADHGALRKRDAAVLQWSRCIAGGPAAVLLSSASGSIPPGPWDRVLRRPATIGSIVECLVTIGTAPAIALQSPAQSVVELRLGPPWPMARCRTCERTRHCQALAQLADRQLAFQALLQFAVEHDRDLGPGCR